MRIKEAFIILFISLLFSFPFFQKGYFATDDGEWAIVRLAEMNREIRDLQIPPRWSDFLNHGFGYPLFLFSYPLPYYLAEAIHLLGIGFTNSIKILFVLSVVVSAFGMYFFSKRYWGRKGAIISSIFYITVPYRLIDLYLRGSLGESVTLMIVPWLFWAVDRYLYKESQKGILVSVLFAALILSHNTSAYIFSLVLFLYLVFYVVSHPRGVPQAQHHPGGVWSETFRVIVPFLIGLMLSAYFWLPVFFEKKFIYLGSFPIADKSQHFVELSELLVDRKDSGIKPPLSLGFVHLAAFILGIGVFQTTRDLKVRHLLVFSYLVSFIAILLLFPFSLPFWKLPGFSSLDFPWRMLVTTAFFLPLISGSISLLPFAKKIGLILTIAALFLYFPKVKVTERFIRDDRYYETNDATTTSADELMPVWVKIKPKDRSYRKVITGNDQISNLFYNSKYIEFVINLERQQQIIVNTLYFPGWKFFLDGKEIPIGIAEDLGTIRLKIPQGNYKIQGKFTRTPVRVLADIISLLGLIIIILSSIKLLRKRICK